MFRLKKQTSKNEADTSFNLPGNPNKVTEKAPVLTAVMMEKLKKAFEARSELVENLLCTEIFEIFQS